MKKKLLSTLEILCDFLGCSKAPLLLCHGRELLRPAVAGTLHTTEEYISPD